MFLLDVSHCGIFNRGIKKVDFPNPSTAISVKFPIEIFVRKNQFQACSYGELFFYLSSLNNFKTHLIYSAQSGFWWIIQIIWCIFLVLLYVSEASNANFVGMKQT